MEVGGGGSNSLGGWLGEDGQPLQQLLQQKVIALPHLVLQLQTTPIQFGCVVTAVCDIRSECSSTVCWWLTLGSVSDWRSAAAGTPALAAVQVPHTIIIHF